MPQVQEARVGIPAWPLLAVCGFGRASPLLNLSVLCLVNGTVLRTEGTTLTKALSTRPGGKGRAQYRLTPFPLFLLGHR